MSTTVVGLGPMGQALAGALLDAGVDVTIWNRIESRAAPLQALHRDVDAAVSAGHGGDEITRIAQRRT